MPFEIIRNDITKVKADAIVNSANPLPKIGSGTDSAIHAAAGEKLLQARQRIGRIQAGDAAATPAYELDARYVIHTVAPVWQGGNAGEAALLRRCYDSALEIAVRKRCRSIAFPLLASGNYGYPRPQALEIAMDAIREFLKSHEMQIYLVVFNREAYALSQTLSDSVASYIDEHYVRQQTRKEYGGFGYSRRSENAEDAAMDMLLTALPPREEMPMPSASMPMDTAEEAPRREGRKKRAKSVGMAAKLTLEELLQQTDEGFSGTLLKLIDRTGKKDSEIYKRANIDRKLFSKIRNNPSYQPSKATALAFAVALELDLEETGDLLARAGYTLSNSSKFDIIVGYFIGNRNYDIYQINTTLFAFDQNLLGGL